VFSLSFLSVLSPFFPQKSQNPPQIPIFQFFSIKKAKPFSNEELAFQTTHG